MPTFARACALLAAIAVCAGAAEKIPHGTVELVSAVASIKPGSNFQTGLLFRLEPGWHIYWRNPGDSGKPLRLEWKLSDGLKPGGFEWPAPKRIPVGPLLDYGYDGTVLLPISIQADKALPEGPQTLRAELHVLVCRETCMPGKASLSLSMPVRGATPQSNLKYAALFAKATQAQPQPLPANWSVLPAERDSSIELTLKGVPQDAAPSFVPAQPNVIENAAPQHLDLQNGTLRLTLKRPANAVGNVSRLDGLLLTEEGDRVVAYRVDESVRAAAISKRLNPPAAASTPNLAAVLLLAFGGGIILNLMPCVFPVLSIKVLGMIDHARGERRTIQTSALFYTIGVLVSFWAIVAVLLGLRAAGHNLGWGFQLQSPGFVAFLICLLFLLGLSLIGTFEIGASLMSAGGTLTTRGRYSSSFFTGVLATVVATPCTAPLMGVAVGFALAQSAAISTLVFTAMALGLAAPFLVLSLFPSLSRLLPRPGAWMETLKQILAFPLFLSVIWLLWVLGQQVGVDQVAILLIALLVLAFAGWMAGRWPQSRWMKTSAVVLGLGAIIYSSITLTSAPANAARVTSSAGLKWEPFTPAKLADYRASGKPVLIDFTAAWCLTCQVNDRVVFHSPQVVDHLNRSKIALLRADWTNQDPEITDLLAKFGRSGIPFYVVYGAGTSTPPITLPDGLLTPSGFLQNLRRANL